MTEIVADWGETPDELANRVYRMRKVGIADTSRSFNTELLAALELANMTEVARATIKSAAYRTESRGAHALDDHPTRDDENWLKHTLFYTEGSRLDYKPVHTRPLSVETMEPKVRTY